MIAQEAGTKRILLVGHTGSHNRGCEALVRTSVDVVRQFSPGVAFTLASTFPEHDAPLRDIEDLAIIPATCRTPAIYGDVATADERRGATSRAPLAKRAIRALLPYGVVSRVQTRRARGMPASVERPRPTAEAEFGSVRHLRRAILSSDVVVSIGGDLFIEDYGPPIHALESVEYAQFLGVRTCVWGASIWPLKTPWIERRVTQMLERCVLLTVRDVQTLEYLTRLGAAANARLVADGAFLMPAKRTQRSLLPWVQRPRHVVGLNVSPLLLHFTSSERHRSVLSELKAFAYHLIDDLGVVSFSSPTMPCRAPRNSTSCMNWLCFWIGRR